MLSQTASNTQPIFVRRQSTIAHKLATELDREMIELAKRGGIPRDVLGELHVKYYSILNAINSSEGLDEYPQKVRRSFKALINILSASDHDNVAYIIVKQDDGSLKVILSTHVKICDKTLAFWKVKHPKLAANMIPEKVSSVDDILAAISDFVVV